MKKRFLTRFLSVILVVMMVVAILPISTIVISANTTYDPDAAIEYAKKHWNDGKGLCAEFVSDCLKAGGFTAVYNVNARQLGRQLQEYGEKISCTGWSSSSCLTAASFSKILSKGDIIIWENKSGSSSSGHAMIYSGENDSKGRILVYAHNSAKNKEIIQPSSSAVVVYAIHLTGSGTPFDHTNPDNYPSPSRDIVYKSSGTMTGDDVRWIQAVLYQLGYDISIDGSFGPSSRDLIKKFQSDYGLTVDGSVGPATRSKLLECWNNRKVGAGVSIQLKTWISNEAMTESIGQVVSGNWAYLNYELVDANTGIGIDSIVNKSYTASMAIYGPDGALEHSNTDSTDESYIGIKRWKEGRYTGIVTISGDINDSVTLYYDMVYDATLVPSVNSVYLNLNETNQQTISYIPTGGYPGKMGITYSYDSSIIEKVSGSWVDGNYVFSVKGLKVGTTTITMNLHEMYSSSQNIVASVAIPVTVTADSYTISYNANGGYDAPSAQTKYYGTNLTLSSAQPWRTGYTFLGWATSSTATRPDYYPGSSYSGNANITLYAVWSQITYTITYDANGGYDAPSSQIRYYGTNLTLSSAQPWRTGYTFLGWATSSTATTATYQPGDTYSLNCGVTLYAVWSPNGYAVIYNANGGSNAPLPQTKYHGINLTLTSVIPTRSGYTFMGWATSSNATTAQYQAGELYENNVGVTLYAVWSQNTYTVIYDANGGSNAPSAQIKLYGIDLTLSSVIPVREGYTFVGWSASSNSVGIGYRAGSTYTFNSSIKLYAVWRVTEYFVIYDANGGSDAPSWQTKVHGTDLTLSSEIPVREGYTFVGWATSDDATAADYSAGATFTEDADTTLYAVWSQNTYTVTYDANGGNGAPSSQTKAYGVELTLSSAIPTREGYTFVGWATSDDAASADYSAGEAYTDESNVTLYAVWQEVVQHIHVFDQQNSDAQYKATDATCQSKATYYYSCLCGEKGTQVFEYGSCAEHSFTNYRSNGDATYQQDGTKTAKCDHCTVTDTKTDAGTALGLDQKFKDEFSALTENADAATTYAELYALLQTYSSLSDSEKSNVAVEFSAVQQMINEYNAQAETANNELSEATELAFAPLATVGFSFVAALWFLLKKKFWM